MGQNWKEGEDSKALVTIDGEGVDWTNHLEEDKDYALMACNNSDSDTEVTSCSNKCKESYANLKKWQYPTMTGKYMPYGLDIEVITHDLPMRQKKTQPSEDEYVSLPTEEQETPKKRMLEKAELTVGGTKVLVKGANGWNNVQRVNKQNQFVPSAVLTRNGKILVNTARASGTKHFSTARQSFNRQTILTSTAMKVNSVKPIVNRLVLLGGKEKLLLSPQQVVIGDHTDTTGTISPNTILDPILEIDYQHRALKNKGIVDSGCSRHMTGNKAYLDEFQDFNSGPVTFGGSKGYITGGLACLIAKATTDESNKWHRMLGYVNFKNLNKLVKGNLVRGLPLKATTDESNKWQLQTTVAEMHIREGTLIQYMLWMEGRLTVLEKRLPGP
ncbi:putative ribonuclease H-like domain-containing protein, partial [Tanacetum coccineum]